MNIYCFEMTALQYWTLGYKIHPINAKGRFLNNCYLPDKKFKLLTWGLSLLTSERAFMIFSRRLMVKNNFLFSLLLIFFLALPLNVQSLENNNENKGLSLAHQIALTHYTDDLDVLKKKKVIRALVVYSQTDFFFSSNGTPKGLQIDLLNEYEKHLNIGVKKAANHIRVKYIPTTFERLLPDLREGKGDIIATLLTITPERKKLINFMSAKKFAVQEVLVSHKSVHNINSLDDLSGREIYVLKGSSYVEHLKEVNKIFQEKNIEPIIIHEADPHLSSEDILELINSGVTKLTVVDDYKANLWEQVLPDIRVHKDIVIKKGTHVGWGIRKDNPELQKSLNTFLKKVKMGSYLGNMFFKRYYKNIKWIKNPNTIRERGKFVKFISLFEKFGDQYGFDSLALVAQGFQESQLNQSKRSHRGAMGIMQLLPSTAADKNVGIPDISKAENNIKAGAKYLAFLRDRYFSDPAISRLDQMAFSWAAYNAGPAKVRKMRTKAQNMGLDPNQWFSNVEIAAGKLVGRETVEYVSNIFKYYIAYTLVQEQMANKK